MSTTTYLAAPGFPGFLKFVEADEVQAAVQRILVDWRLERPVQESGVEAGEVVVSVRGLQGRWVVSAATLEKDCWFSDPVSAACSVVANLLQARMAKEQDLLCLHAAACEIGGGLVVMPSRYRAGKSVLAAALAAAGERIFNDDVVLIDPSTGEGIAPGIAPRLRLPLPADLDDTTRTLVDTSIAVQGAHYRYLDLPPSKLARQGERASIRGFVLLDRSDEGTATLSCIPPGELLRQLIWQNFARAGAPRRIVDTLAALAEAADCLQLSYSDPAEAAALLRDHFSGKAEPAPMARSIVLCPDQAAYPDDAESVDLRPGTLLRRTKDAQLIKRAGAAFVTTAWNGGILHLNATGVALWALLDAPLSFRDILEVFSLAFPDTERSTLADDLERTIAALAGHGLVKLHVPASASRGLRRGGAVCLALAAAVVFAQPSAASVMRGCEAREISALLAPGSQAAWRGEDKEIGPLHFRHQISLTCNDGACLVNGGLFQKQGEDGRWGASIASDRESGRTAVGALPLGSAPPARSRQIGGPEASELKQAVEHRGWRDKDGSLRFVWVDYARVAGRINLRARSEIACLPDHQACVVTTTILAHIAYNERDPCMEGPTG